MKKVNYVFNEDAWGMVGINFNYDATPEIEGEIVLLRELYPEIAGWGDLSLFTAWGSFSQDHYELKWQPVLARDDLFLGYLYHVEQSTGAFSWSATEAEQAIEDIFQ